MWHNLTNHPAHQKNAEGESTSTTDSKKEEPEKTGDESKKTDQGSKKTESGSS